MKGSEIDVKLDNKYLNKYKKNMLKIMKDIFIDEDEEELESIIIDLINENVQDIDVTLDNNYTEESRNTKALSVLDWCLKKEPIIAGNGTFYKNQYEAINPIAQMLKNFLVKRKAFKKEMFMVEDNTSRQYRTLDLNQGNEKVNCNS